jgi:hypothetical protein
MTIEDLKKQIVLQSQMERLVADKITVTDQEVAQYIADNAIDLPVGEEEATTAQIKDGLRNQKLNTEGSLLIATLKDQAKINYFVNY